MVPRKVKASMWMGGERIASDLELKENLDGDL